MESNYKSLIVWQKAFSLTEKIYRESKTFPKEELYTLGDQLRRSALSIPSNIAEWSWRIGEADKKRFFIIARWSACEVETQILIARSLGYMEGKTAQELLNLCEEILKILTTLIYKS